MRIIVIDNYDSFTYNLVHVVKSFGHEVRVVRNDQFEIGEIGAYDKIVLSPGPGIPEEAGLLLEVIRKYAGVKPMLGICLGEQAIGQVFGGKLVNLKEVFHGVRTPVRITARDYIFEGLPDIIEVGRYHSWVVSKDGFPDVLEVTSLSEDGEVMALRHRTMDIRGLQFHPESVLTPDGIRIIRNWLEH